MIAPIIVRSDLDDAGLSPAAFRVLGHLARRAGARGQAFPGVDSIARICRLHKDTVWRALNELESAGWIARKPRPGRTSVYVIVSPSGKDGVAGIEGRPLIPCSPIGNEGPRVPDRDGREALEKRGCERETPKGDHIRNSKEKGAPPAPFSDLPEEARFRFITIFGGDKAAAAEAYSRWRGRKLDFRENFDTTDDAIEAAQSALRRECSSRASVGTLEIRGWYPLLVDRAQSLGLDPAVIPHSWTDLSESDRQIVRGQRERARLYADGGAR